MDIGNLDIDSFCDKILRAVESGMITGREALDLIIEYWRELK